MVSPPYDGFGVIRQFRKTRHGNYRYRLPRLQWNRRIGHESGHSDWGHEPIGQNDKGGQASWVREIY